MWSALAGAAIQAIGSAVGQVMSARANKERQRLNDALYREQVRDSNEQRYTDFMKTDAGQALLNDLKTEYKNTITNQTQNGMRRGATDEQKHAVNKQANDTYAKAFGQLSQAAQAYRQAGIGQYNTIIANARAGKSAADNARLAQTNQSAMNLAANAGKTGQALIGSDTEIGKVKSTAPNTTEEPDNNMAQNLINNEYDKSKERMIV